MSGAASTLALLLASAPLAPGAPPPQQVAAPAAPVALAVDPAVALTEADAPKPAPAEATAPVADPSAPVASQPVDATPVAAEPPVAPASANAAAPETAPAPAEAAPAPEAGSADAADNEIIVEGQAGHPPGDPLEKLNAKSYDVAQSVDDSVVAPAARIYEHGLPTQVRAGVSNVIHNLDAPVTFLNDLLQLKPGRAAKTLVRFTINSTIGIAGLIDVAKRKPFKLPYRDNGFANTFGYYGIKPGPYLFLPFVGPTTLRDVIGDALDKLVLPVGVGKPFNTIYYGAPAVTLKVLDRRVRIDEELQRERATDDPYAAAREFYLKRRAAEIEALHSRHKREADARAKAQAEAEAQAPAADATVQPPPPTPSSGAVPAPNPSSGSGTVPAN